MCLSVQTVLVIVIVAFSKVGSQPCHCDDVTKLAICNRPMSLLESGCKLATKVLQNSAIFRRFFGVSLESQNTATINPTIGQFTINADTSPLLLASSEINQATVTIVVLSILLGVCVIIITVWGIYECVRRKRGKERKRRAEEALALYEKRRRQLKLDGDQLKAKKEDAPTVKGDLEEWSDCEENTSPGSDAHQESNGRRNKPDGNKRESLL